MKLKELFVNESTWTKGELARDRHGNPINHHSERAVCFCIEGAISRCRRGNPTESIEEIKEKIVQYLKLSGSFDCIAKWNDAPERKFKDIVALVNELDI